MSTEKNLFLDIFKNGSQTYFYSSKFFPKKVKKDVQILYGFVRTIDNFVDSNPQKTKDFFNFKKEFYKARNGKLTQNNIIKEFVELEKNKRFEKVWADSFFKSMEMDLEDNKITTLKEIEKYMHGSAEVIGLFMSKIIGIDKRAYKCARLLGKSMQYINFIRDLDEDIDLGRNYFPLADYLEFGLEVQNKKSMINNKTQFKKFIKKQLSRYYSWQKSAEKGYKYLPKQYLAPIKTASDMYKWTAKVIEKDPLIIFKKKVKPSQFRILSQGLINQLKETSIFNEK